MSEIAQNLKSIRQKIAAAAESSRRSPDEIELMAVTKNATLPQIQEAVSNGITSLGENRVRSLRSRANRISAEGITWHMIGHLQKNKVRKVLRCASSIQSVDSKELAETIDTQGAKASRIVDILIQVNIAGDDNKYGLDPADIKGFLFDISSLSNLRVRGLMTILPYFDDPEKSRPYFRRMYQLFTGLKEHSPHPESFTELSMGMTNDFEIAVEEGATIVRLGTALFGR